MTCSDGILVELFIFCVYIQRERTKFCDVHVQSQLPLSYMRSDQVESWTHDPLTSFEDRSDSPAYVQSNCQTMSGRDARVRRLMEFRDLHIRSYGR